MNRIYFAQLETGEIKVGCTKNASRRVPALASQYGPARLLGTIEGGYVDERIIHNRFRPYWIKGELFMANAEIFAMAGVPELYKPDPKYADRLLSSAWKSALGKCLCKHFIANGGLKIRGCEMRNPWWFAFYPPAIPLGEVVRYGERWWRTRNHFLEGGFQWLTPAHWERYAEKRKTEIAWSICRKARAKLKAQFSEPWLAAMADADVTRRYLARQARLARPHPAR
jgi:hypothetical protein